MNKVITMDITGANYQRTRTVFFQVQVDCNAIASTCSVTGDKKRLDAL